MPTNELNEITDTLPPMTDGQIQLIGNPDALASGAEPVKRLLTLEDLEDDCPICEANRALIEAGNPPMVLIFE